MALRLSSRSPLTHLLGLAALTSVLAPACSKSSGSSSEEQDPPTLEFLGAQNSLGTTYETDEEPSIAHCDPRLTLLLGPIGDGDGLLQDWDFRPPGTCAENNTQCGYLRVIVNDTSGDPVLTSEQAVLNPVLDLAAVDSGSIASFEATLITGNTGEPFEVDGATVTATWDTGVGVVDCADGMGGMGGNPGTGGTGPGGAGGAPGGAGGAQ